MTSLVNNNNDKSLQCERSPYDRSLSYTFIVIVIVVSINRPLIITIFIQCNSDMNILTFSEKHTSSNKNWLRKHGFSNTLLATTCPIRVHYSILYSNFVCSFSIFFKKSKKIYKIFSGKMICIRHSVMEL